MTQFATHQPQGWTDRHRWLTAILVGVVAVAAITLWILAG